MTHAMTQRERYVNALLYKETDVLPLTPGGGRKSTREAWYGQGLPRNVRDITEYAYRSAGGTREWPRHNGYTDFPVLERMMPMFEEKVIEVKEDSHIVQDWKGNICEIGKEFDVSYLRNAVDFVTRRWIKCPVENRADWEDMKRRYNPDDPARLPADAAARADKLLSRDWFLEFHFSGPFWQLREWLGFENLCMTMANDPDFVHEMLFFWQEYIVQLMENAFRYVTPDSVHISEDMAYKSYSMISPEMTREFLMPVWRRWGEVIRAHGIKLFACDSDGFIGELLPLWIEAGINVCDPIEVAAGNDIVAFSKRFGKNMAYRGGVDKRAMAKGGRVIEAEMERIAPAIANGGFIPSCDHGVPPDVSWPDFVNYTKLLAHKTGWM
ncbi:MAG: hypothetical protein HZC28_11060 [Spirochaetes bacterium]|nr:hypothetical protein [Spirochaetota bacterium]